MGFIKRRASTKAKVSVEDYEEKEQFLYDIKAILEDIPLDLIINWDQTGMHSVPVSLGQWLRRGLRGLKSVELTIKDR